MAWVVLGLYWPAQFITTHIPRPPQLQIFGRDVTLHVTAYFILTVLYWLARYGGVRPDLRQFKTYAALGLMALYAVVDELTQKLVGRDCDFLDWVSNMSGILLALALVFLLRRVVYWLIFYWVGMFLVTHWPGKSAFIMLPVFWRQFHIAYVVMGYLVLTMLWWRSMCPEPKFMITARVAISSVFVLPAYALFSEVVNLTLGRGFNLTNLLSSLGGIILGAACAAALARHNIVMEQYKN